MSEFEHLVGTIADDDDESSDHHRLSQEEPSARLSSHCTQLQLGNCRVAEML